MLHDGPAPATEAALQTLGALANYGESSNVALQADELILKGVDDSRKLLCNTKISADLRGTLEHNDWTVRLVTLQTLGNLMKCGEIYISLALPTGFETRHVQMISAVFCLTLRC